MIPHHQGAIDMAKAPNSPIARIALPGNWLRASSPPCTRRSQRCLTGSSGSRTDPWRGTQVPPARRSA
ncbi:MAG: hypothetical protein P4M09_01255 [Devosia sp.]|nr:hypothetical protein [Devosia sp.]